MVCLSDDVIQATVTDTCDLGAKKPYHIQLTSTKVVENIFVEVGSYFSYDPGNFELILQKRNGDTIVLNNYKDKTLGDIGGYDQNGRITITVCPLKKKNISLVVNDTTTEDDLLLGASASPTMNDVPSTSLALMNDIPSNSLALMNVDFCSPRNKGPNIDARPIIESCNYVGLVNQAMTCYLNSLLQALYMTPEFRNALYNWEFDGQSQEQKSIPFQLQKLFLNLQTSSKSSVETTDLTHSFGWDMQAAWEQHDIQELCRVMFDALEQTFKNTKQANLINDLYEGKMLDYVKCLDCSTEKSREDTFLDIPLPVRPFGSNVAYNSVEEALRAFVQPETLDGNNQYFCEKCNKKCDAHKGLKFIKFPYLLTLHLKRFDFDYSTMHRIKLNDKVVFSEVLNLNSFIPGVISLIEDALDERETVVKCDDCSTTDSGSALDDESCQGTDVSSTVNGQDDNCQDDDEGIDVSSGNHHHENEKNRLQEPKGPYIYELFSIMIHSGSASGGHYYAYIKDFSKDQWICFNDQIVNTITEEDIKKTYGGGPQRGYYSGAYTASTNAYMLMYRQIDKQRNCTAMSVEEFPSYLKNLLQLMREKEEIDRIAKEKETNTIKLKVYCSHPLNNQLIDTTLYLLNDNTLSEAVEDAYERLSLKDIVSLENCRLVTYNKLQDCIDFSFDRDDYKFCDIMSRMNFQCNDWYLDVRQPGTEFEVYRTGGVKMKVYVVNLELEEVTGPTHIRINAGETIRDVKIRLANMFDVDVDTLKVVLETYSNEPRLLDEDDVPMKFDPSCNGYKLYISNALDEDDDKTFIISKMHKVIDRFVHIVTIEVTLPENDIGTLESLSIPPLDLNQNSDRNEITTSEHISPSPQSGPIMMEGFGDQSNSEDSSLSDSDRTLVGDVPGDCIGLLSSSSNSPADQHMASPSDPAEDTYNHDVFGVNWHDEEMPEQLPRCTNYYFKATLLNQNNMEGSTDRELAKSCRVMIDKRMNLAKLKKCLEPYVGVSMEYFKIYRQYPNQAVELTSLTETLSSTKDGERLLAKLGRVLRKNEYSGQIFHLTPENSETFTFLFEWIIGKGQTVGTVKKEILLQAKKQHMLDIPYSKCRLRKKNWRNPSKVYLDDQKFVDDILINNNFELFLQELGDCEKATHSTQLVLFVKRWCPATLTLAPFHEVILDNSTMDDLKKKIAKESGIPEDYVDVAYLKSSFPCDMNILDIHSELDWNPNVINLEKYPLQVYDDGNVFLYRDSREQLKDITPEEKKEINQRENARLGRFSSKTYSPRRERGLKIYLDTSPNKTDDNVTD